VFVTGSLPDVISKNEINCPLGLVNVFPIWRTAATAVDGTAPPHSPRESQRAPINEKFLLTNSATSQGINRWWVYLDRKRRDSMRTMGLLATVALAVLGAAAAALTLAAIPDITRYLRIRRM
jgi:hypothetical protein